MKKLSYKIFIAIFLTMISVALMIWSLRYFLNRHFLDYINQAEFDRQTYLVEQLKDEYKTQQGWDNLRSNRRAFMERIMRAIEENASERLPSFDRERMPDHMQRRGMENGMRPGPPFGPGRELGQRLFLLDAEKNLVVGSQPSSNNDFILREITDGEEVIGWLGLRKRERMETPPEMAFLRQQYGLLYMVGGGILVVSLLVSLLLARHLLAPIKQLKSGTQAITSRKFGTRISVTSNDELGQLAEDFNHMAQTLEKYEEMRHQWMSDVSHELRTPLAVLRGEIEAIQDGVRGFSPERIESLHSEVLHVSKIVNDLHDLSLAETQSLSFRKETVNPIKILEETAKSFKTRLAERRIDVQNDLGDGDTATISGDPDRLGQLFSNLLENVVRYTNAPGVLKMWHEQRDTNIRLYLEDSGPGVPESSVARLFDRFYRVDKSRSRELGGSGLGLSICRTIVETMGGQIRAKNGPSGGLQIEMVFPIS